MVMTLETAIQTYGYWAIVVGTFFEGETILILGGFAAHRGYLSLPWVIAAALAGTICGDQLFFFLGRWRARVTLERHPAWEGKVAKARKLMDRFKTPLLLVFRFLYGLRSVIPFVVGMSNISVPQFAFFNVMGAIVWAVAVGTVGYLFGNTVEAVIGNVKRYEFYFFAGIASSGALIWILFFLHRRKRKGLLLKPSNSPH
jgi:membrane protein DedA with SNARE-associated domain